MQEFDQLIERICKDSGKEKSDIEKLIFDKQDELSGLVSKEGAAYIVGRELGVNLIKEGRKEFKIKNIVADLSFIDLEAKVVRIFDLRTFEKKKSLGKGRNGTEVSFPSNIGSVQNVIIGDETGTVFLVLWGEDIEKIKGIEEGNSVKITNSFSKVSGKSGGGIELGLRKRGAIEKIDKNIEVFSGKTGMDSKAEFSGNRIEIKDLKEDILAEVRGCFVQIFKRTPVYFVCPQCNSSLGLAKNCKSHGDVQPKKSAMLSAVLDDGTEVLRVIMFREIAERLYKIKADEIDLNNLEAFYESLDFLGKEVLLGGRIKKNNYSGEKEMVVNKIEEIDSKKECEVLLGELGVN